MLYIENVYTKRLYTKRIFDIVGSLFCLIIFSPFILLTIILIFFETGFPIVYKNERVGRGGKEFWLYKFREYWWHFCTKPESGEALEHEEKLKASHDQWKNSPVYHFGSGKADPRRTPVGRWIDRHFIGEMLNFLNVIKGEMSIVGPRPHQVREVKNYPPEYLCLLSVLPGITGLGQIANKKGMINSFEQEASLSLEYISLQSLWLDVKICLQTFFLWVKTWRKI